MAKRSEGLNEQQKLFCDHYLNNGFNAKQAAISAGYAEGSAEVQGSRLLSNDKVSKYLEVRTKEASNKRIADIIERKEFLSSTMRGQEDCDHKDRLKACEVLGKMEGDFTEKIEITGSLSALIKESRERG